MVLVSETLSTLTSLTSLSIGASESPSGPSHVMLDRNCLPPTLRALRVDLDGAADVTYSFPDLLRVAATLTRLEATGVPAVRQLGSLQVRAEA